MNEERELARKNAVAGWLLAALFVVLAGGVVAVAFIYNAVSSY